jgi:hypothetical protein
MPAKARAQLQRGVQARHYRAKATGGARVALADR